LAAIIAAMAEAMSVRESLLLRFALCKQVSLVCKFRSFSFSDHQSASLSGKMSTLRLDSDIRNWVLIPITVAMFFVGIVRHNVGKLMHRDRKVDLKALREAQAVIRAERVRNNSGYLQSAGFRMRKHFFCAPVSEQSTPRGPIVTLSSMAPALVPSRPQRLT